jgi:hypothetical protein
VRLKKAKSLLQTQASHAMLSFKHDLITPHTTPTVLYEFAQDAEHITHLKYRFWGARPYAHLTSADLVTAETSCVHWFDQLRLCEPLNPLKFALLWNCRVMAVNTLIRSFQADREMLNLHDNQHRVVGRTKSEELPPPRFRFAGFRHQLYNCQMFSLPVVGIAWFASSY